MILDYQYSASRALAQASWAKANNRPASQAGCRVRVDSLQVEPGDHPLQGDLQLLGRVIHAGGDLLPHTSHQLVPNPFLPAVGPLANSLPLGSILVPTTRTRHRVLPSHQAVAIHGPLSPAGQANARATGIPRHVRCECNPGAFQTG